MTNIYRFGIIGGGLCIIFYDVIWGVSQLVGDLVRGNQLLRIGKLEEAVDAYQKAIAHHPIFHWSHYKLGEAYEQSGNWTKAVAAYRKAVELNSDSIGFHYQLAVALVATEQLDAALDVLKAGLKLQPSSYHYYHLLGKCLAEKEQWQEAIVNYQKALEFNPNLPQKVTKDWQAIIEELESIRQTDPRKFSQKNYVSLAEAYRNNQQLSQAEFIAIEGLQKYPQNAQIQNQYAIFALVEGNWIVASEQLEKLLEMEAQKNWRTWVRLIQAYRNSKQFEKAELTAVKGLQKYRNHPMCSTIQKEYCLIPLGQKDWGQEIEKLERLLQMQGQNTHEEVYADLVAAYSASQQFQKAERLVAEGLQKYPKSSLIKSPSDGMSIGDKDWESVAQALEELLQIQGDQASDKIYADLVQAYRSSQQFEKAELMATEGLQKYPKSARIQIQSERLSLRETDWGVVIEALEDKWQIAGEKASEELYADLVKAYRSSQQFNKAKLIATEGLQKYPNSVSLERESSLIRLSQTDGEVLSQRVEELLRLEGEQASAWTYSYLVKAYRSSQQFEKAELMASEGLQKYPDNSAIKTEYSLMFLSQKGLGAALEKLGQLWQMSVSQAADENQNPLEPWSTPHRKTLTKFNGDLFIRQYAETISQQGISINIRFQAQLKSQISLASSPTEKLKLIFADMANIGDYMTSKNNDEALELGFTISSQLAEVIADDLEQIPFAFMDRDSWLRLKNFLIGNYFIMSGYLIRQKIAEFDSQGFVCGQIQEEADILRCLKLFIEQRDELKSKTALKKLLAICQKPSQLKSYLQLYLLNYEREKASEFEVGVNDIKAEESYAQLINGKTVAIVGPAPTSEPHGEEIDFFDVVIRMTYLDNLDESLYPYTGQKTSVSYYNGGNSTSYKSYIRLLIPQLQFVCLKTGLALSELRQHSVNVRVCRRVNLSCYVGSPNLLPIILSDLAAFQPQKIKVFGNNLFLSKNLHFENYPSFFIHKKFIKKLGSSLLYAHDLASQFSQVKNFWLSGLFEADPDLTEVLKLEVDEYIYEMEKLYGNHNLLMEDLG
ncbi:TPR domain protein [Limnospira platensis NIES-39]|uniref:TPR domain protein n=1 Tax=Limnospira platensis NIES-46 TaxID=1236695 RepID=A0A5M3T3L2_LIMPL|nr:tetratricopeptide repeat protein [Arthrospira platensis]BAI87848.1 TPR domain protein [Arthrospira platensis NIES-39]BDT10283.1 TPR domain protein [Arthrospira platensis NIES-39]GCE92470.1 TPR domain protein [Arthrospira platensis NIES-46]